MILKIYTVYDSKAEAYLEPFYAESTGLAIRRFTESVNTPNHPFNKYPSDFCLFEVGTYDTQKCKIETNNALVNLGLAVEFKKTEHKPIQTEMQIQ